MRVLEIVVLFCVVLAEEEADPTPLPDGGEEISDVAEEGTDAPEPEVPDGEGVSTTAAAAPEGGSTTTTAAEGGGEEEVAPEASEAPASTTTTGEAPPSTEEGGGAEALESTPSAEEGAGSTSAGEAPPSTEEGGAESGGSGDSTDDPSATTVADAIVCYDERSTCCDTVANECWCVDADIEEVAGTRQDGQPNSCETDTEGSEEPAPNPAGCHSDAQDSGTACLSDLDGVVCYYSYSDCCGTELPFVESTCVDGAWDTSDVDHPCPCDELDLDDLEDLVDLPHMGGDGHGKKKHKGHMNLMTIISVAVGCMICMLCVFALVLCLYFRKKAPAKYTLANVKEGASKPATQAERTPLTAPENQAGMKPGQMMLPGSARPQQPYPSAPQRPPRVTYPQMGQQMPKPQLGFNPATGQLSYNKIQLTGMPPGQPMQGVPYPTVPM